MLETQGIKYTVLAHDSVIFVSPQIEREQGCWRLHSREKEGQSKDFRFTSHTLCLFRMVHFVLHWESLKLFSYSPEFPSRWASINFVDSVPQSKGSTSIGWSNGLLNQLLVKEGWYSIRKANRAKPRRTQRHERNLMRGTTLFSCKRKKSNNFNITLSKQEYL